MKIGIDARMIDWSGVGRYTRELLGGLASIDQSNQYILFSNQGSSVQIPNAPNFFKSPVNLEVFSATNQLKWAQALENTDLDLFHSPHFVFPLYISCPSIVTIHDLIPLIHPEVLPSFVKRKYYRIQNKKAIKKATTVIAVSSSTKKDILKIFGAAEEKIEVIHEAASKNFKVIQNEDLIKNIRNQYKLGNRFILSVGNSKPHKNWIELIKAFYKLKKTSQFKCQLVLVGNQDPRFLHCKNLVTELRLEKDIRFINFAAEEKLTALYNAACVFVLPSLYEGFGLPVLEAMACGTPVVCSNTSSLAEVAGEAALLTKPSSKDIADAIWKVLTEETTRNKLSQKGLARVNEFSWQKTAAQTLAAYKDVANKS